MYIGAKHDELPRVPPPGRRLLPHGGRARHRRDRLRPVRDGGARLGGEVTGTVYYSPDDKICSYTPSVSATPELIVTEPNGGSTCGDTISPDGRYIAYMTRGSEYPLMNVVVHDRMYGTNKTVCTDPVMNVDPAVPWRGSATVVPEGARGDPMTLSPLVMGVVSVMRMYVPRPRAGETGTRRRPDEPELALSGLVTRDGIAALQRVAGNRAVTRFVQRCGGTPGQGVPGAEEELPVQRAVAWAAGPVHEVNNLADCVINGTAAGVTWPSLNGTQFWSGPAVRGAMVRPTVRTAAAGGGFDAAVDVIGNNTGSYDETVLRAGPWRLNTTKAAVRAAVPALARSLAGAGNTRFRALGDPTDAHMFTANRRHEDHHAADHRDAFNATIGAWDAKLVAAKAAGTKFHGATAAAAESALWAAMGGTPDQVADAFFNACVAAVVAYHGSAAGGPVGAPTRPGASGGGAVSWARYRNPS